MELPILYEDEDIVAVDKPAGLLTHASPTALGESADDWFKAKYPEGGPASPDASRGGYAHRLDRETSGVLVFAKRPAALEFLRKQFSEREVKKTYLALTYGAPREKKGTIDFDIGRSRKDFRLRSAQPKARGTLREAITRYEVLGEDGRYALLKVLPETGRTHQIRVHLKAIHHPVVGDPLYAPHGGENDLGLKRLALHAYEIDLPLPSGGRKVITAPLPEPLKGVFDRFGLPPTRAE